jgi:hypothetical protein
MARGKPDPQRMLRIQQEIVADAHDAEEQAMGWFAYLEERLRFPFQARCIVQRSSSPLRQGQVVEVVDLASTGEWDREMFVTVTWEQRSLAVPLAQLKVIQADAATKQAVEDWHYWVQQGY